MEMLNKMITKRIATIEADILAGSFKDQASLEVEIERVINNILVPAAVLDGLSKEDAINHLQSNFVRDVEEFYKKNTRAKKIEKAPDNYAFEKKQAEIETLINNGNLEEADKKIEEILSMINNEDVVHDSIDNGIFSLEDVDYFRNVACPRFEDMKDDKIVEIPEKQGFLQRVKNGFVFMATGKNPYDNQTVKINKEDIKTKILNSKLANWAKKHKVVIAALGAATLLGAGVTIGSIFLHDQAEENLDDDSKIEDSQSDGMEMSMFEVDEYHNFNMNDQNTHTLKLQLLAQAMMERGIPVVSETECMHLELEGKLAVSPKQLNNWLISINLEDMDDLTFTKLLADSNTDKEELSSDFLNVNRLLGKIYTTKEDNPFIYEFISNKEYSEYIKIYEEAIIENQKGNSEELIALIKNRVSATSESTSTGPLGMLTSRLIYLQANVYNAQVIGQEIMNLYNINGDCTTVDTKACFYQDNWAEYMRKLNQKLAAAISYTDSEAYTKYFLSLETSQMGNKVVIEEQVLPYLEETKVQLGKWDVLEDIANYNAGAKGKSTSGSSNGRLGENGYEKTTIETVSKVPTTEAEKAVQGQVEAELEIENQESFKNVAQEYAETHGGIANVTENGDIVILTPDKKPITIDGDTKGAYDASKDYQGTVYDDYEDYRDQHRGQVENVDGVGKVVVTDEGKLTITNPNVYLDGRGNLVQKTEDGKIHEVQIGSKEEIESILDRHPELSEWQIVDEGRTHYSEVDEELPQSSKENSSHIYQQNTTKRPSEETNSVLNTVDQNVLGTLTPEEQAELEAMLNAGREPIAGEIVEETYSDVVYGNYTVPQLMSNPALCKNIPENILKSQYPEIWSTYQSWVSSQEKQVETKAEVSTSTEDIASQIAALESEKTKLTGGEVDQTETIEKAL